MRPASGEAEPRHLPEVGLEIGLEFRAGHERLVPVFPRGVEQMLVGVRAQIVPVGGQAPDDVRELRRPIEIAGEEERGLDAFVPEDPADVLAAVAERAAGEDEGQAGPRGVAADDAAGVHNERGRPRQPAPAGRGGPQGPGGRQGREDGEQPGPRPACPQAPGHFSAATAFQPLILTTGSSPPRSSVRNRAEIFRVSWGRSVT